METEWGYFEGSEKIHCFKEFGELDLKISLCGRIIVFKPIQKEEKLEDNVNVCFGCLLGYIRKGEKKP